MPLHAAVSNPRLDAQGLARVTIGVHGPAGSEDVEFIVDTGFTGALQLSQTIANRLGLARRALRAVLLADGQLQTVPVYRAEVECLGGRQSVEVLVGRGTLAILGLKLLASHRLVLDYPSVVVQIE